MTSAVYFESSVFLDIFQGRDPDGSILSLLRELKKKKVKVYTSIITIEEVSVDHFRKGKLATENYSKVHKFAQIESITQEIALTAAKFEANLLDSMHTLDDQQRATENKKRRWDLFHVATAMTFRCTAFYTSDSDFQKRQERLGITSMAFLAPKPDNLPLDLKDSTNEGTQTSFAPPAPLSGSPTGSTPSEAGTEANKEKSEAQSKAKSATGEETQI